MIKIIDTLHEKIGIATSWLTTLLVMIICLDVILRYLFQWSTAALFEMEWHLFATIFLVAAAYTLKHDKHVRVDVFYSRFGEKQKAWVNLLGTLVFLFPFCFVVIKSSLLFVANSYQITETSPDPGGLPFRFIIKATIPLGFILLALQGISQVARSIQIILHPKHPA